MPFTILNSYLESSEDVFFMLLSMPYQPPLVLKSQLLKLPVFPNEDSFLFLLINDKVCSLKTKQNNKNGNNMEGMKKFKKNKLTSHSQVITTIKNVVTHLSRHCFPNIAVQFHNLLCHFYSVVYSRLLVVDIFPHMTFFLFNGYIVFYHSRISEFVLAF